MPSPAAEAMSTAIGISQQLIPDNNSVGSALKLASAIGAGIISSTLRGFSTFSNWGLLILLIQLYLVWVASSRYDRLKAIKAKHGFTKDPKTYQDMTVDVAQEVEKNLAEWEMPWVFELGWLSNFLAVSKSALFPPLSLHQRARTSPCLPVSLSIISLLSVYLLACPYMYHFLVLKLCISFHSRDLAITTQVIALPRYIPLPQSISPLLPRPMFFCLLSIHDSRWNYCDKRVAYPAHCTAQRLWS
jgi:hypothetical protein